MKETETSLSVSKAMQIASSKGRNLKYDENEFYTI